MLNCCKWAKVGGKQITQQGTDMANNVEQQMKLCSYEQKMTLHYRNASKPNWILHLILAVFTGGLWLIPMFFMAMGGGKKGLWTCSQCGTTQN